MTFDSDKIESILTTALESGRDSLLESEGIALLECLDFRVPKHVFLPPDGEFNADDLTTLRSDRVVIKIDCRDLAHKSDVGGVAITDNNSEAIKDAIDGMKTELSQERIEGFSIHEFIAYDGALGNELILGARYTPDFGPVVVFGPGGVSSEFVSEKLSDVNVLHADVAPREGIENIVRQSVVGALATGAVRSQGGRADTEELAACVERVRQLAALFAPHYIREFEINPLVVSDGHLYALDVLVKLGDGSAPEAPVRPVRKLKNLLAPKSIAIAGVSKRLNPGHVILNNLVREGFDVENIYVVKPDTDSIEGCRCYPSIPALPHSVDLFVLSVDAAQIPDSLTDIIDNRSAESIIVIPGGLEEKSGSEEIVSRMYNALRASRETEWQGPLINGGNSLGIDSRPGRYNTIFLPDYKLGLEGVDEGPVASISQSGAFTVARQSKLGYIRPRYTISVGNQTDVTIGDYMDYLKDDPDVHVFAVYVEGFRPLDGLRFLKAAEEITASGRAVVLYRAGRTEAGARATASHTASIAGDFTVTRALAKNAGVIVAETIEDFEDLTMLLCMLRDKKVEGRRLGAVSNAGFECVAIADNLRRFQIEPFGSETTGTIANILKDSRLNKVIDVNNPLDLTPIASETAYEAAIRAVLEDDGVDVGVFGCVPLTPALETLASGDAHRENVDADDALPARIARLFAEHEKAFIGVVDGGAIYDPMAKALRRGGVPVLRTADRAMRLFDQYCESRTQNR